MVEEAAADTENGASPEPVEEAVTGFSEPTEADFARAEIESERARLAAQRMSWRRRTATGAILSGLALGFQQVFEDKQQGISVIVQTSGEPPTDLPVEAELEGLAPRRSVVKIRPWLLGEDGEDGEDGEEGDEAAAVNDGPDVAQSEAPPRADKPES